MSTPAPSLAVPADLLTDPRLAPVVEAQAAYSAALDALHAAKDAADAFEDEVADQAAAQRAAGLSGKRPPTPLSPEYVEGRRSSLRREVALATSKARAAAKAVDTAIHSRREPIREAEVSRLLAEDTAAVQAYEALRAALARREATAARVRSLDHATAYASTSHPAHARDLGSAVREAYIEAVDSKETLAILNRRNAVDPAWRDIEALVKGFPAEGFIPDPLESPYYRAVARGIAAREAQEKAQAEAQAAALESRNTAARERHEAAEAARREAARRRAEAEAALVARLERGE
jgi:hypothetical protein